MLFFKFINFFIWKICFFNVCLLNSIHYLSIYKKLTNTWNKWSQIILLVDVMLIWHTYILGDMFTCEASSCQWWLYDTLLLFLNVLYWLLLLDIVCQFMNSKNLFISRKEKSHFIVHGTIIACQIDFYK